MGGTEKHVERRQGERDVSIGDIERNIALGRLLGGESPHQLRRFTERRGKNQPAPPAFDGSVFGLGPGNFGEELGTRMVCYRSGMIHGQFFLRRV
jgi:hypothetical protein